MHRKLAHLDKPGQAGAIYGVKMDDDLKNYRATGAFQLLTEEQAGIAVGILVAVLLILDLLGAFK